MDGAKFAKFDNFWGAEQNIRKIRKISAKGYGWGRSRPGVTQSQLQGEFEWES